MSIRILAHEDINPNDIDMSALHQDAKEHAREFLYDVKNIWAPKLRVAMNAATDAPVKFYPVQNAGTAIEICDVTGMCCMCDLWELEVVPN